MLTQIEAKTGAAGDRETGFVSGRAYALAQNNERLIGVIEPTPGVSGSSAWGIVITGNATSARQFWNSIEMEREGSAKTAMRALGPTKLIAELPYELAPALRSASNGQRRYEASWDGMNVDIAVDQAAGENMRWDTKTTVQSYINKARAKQGITGFKSERTAIKFGKMTGDLATISFREGTRDYKIWNIVTFSGNEGYSIEIVTDPKRADHTLTAARLLETIRVTDISTWGWKPFALGNITVEAPSAFKATKQSADVAEWESEAAAMPLTVREVVLPDAVKTDPDAASAQSVQIMKMLPGMASAQHTGTQRRIVDGLPARLVDYTWKNAGFTNRRSQLFIYGATRTWVVDAIAAENYKDWLARLFDTVRVQVPESGARLQRIGAMNASFKLGQNPIEITTLEPPAAEIKAIVQSIVPLPAGGVFAIIDQTLAEDGQVLKQQSHSFYESFSKPLGAGPPAETHSVTLDGARGFHLRGKATAGGVVKDTDFLLLARGKGMLVLFILSDPNSGDRVLRDEIFNSLRLVGY
jgi:hypothetical protein